MKFKKTNHKFIKILILSLFLITLCNISLAITETHIWDKDISFSDNYQKAPSGTQSNRHAFERIYTSDINDIAGLYFASVSVDVDKIHSGAFPKTSEYWNIQFKIDTDILGTGIAGYSKGQSKIFINYWIQSEGGLKPLSYTGAQKIIISGMPGYSASGEMNVEYGHQSSPSAYKFMPYRRITDTVYIYGGGNQDINYYVYQYFYNEIQINDDGNIINVSVLRSEGNKSKFKISDPYEQINETVFSYEDIDIWTVNKSVSLYGINLNNDIFDYTYIETTKSNGIIKLNQSSYTEPEDIQIDVELIIYNFDFNSYYIITEVSEDLDTWDNVAGTYNGTTKIVNTIETRILDVDTWLYDLPIWIRSRLVEYDKLTGEYTTVDTTPAVLYNPPTPDSIKFGGTVIDADTNQIIAGATVSVEGVTTTSDTTNAFGEFLMYIYPGIYTVTASKTGYQTYTSEELLMEVDNTWAQIYLTPIGYGNGTLYGNVNDADTGYAIQDVHVIITNATDSISAYTSPGGYYEATGLAQSSTYTIRAVKSGYYTYNGSVTTEASGASHKSFNMVQETATPTPTATVLPTSTYPGGEGHEWTNDEIVTMLRVLVPGFFLLMLVFLLMAVMLGINGNNGNNGQGRSGLSEIWRR